MSYKNYAQKRAIEQNYRKKFLELNPNLNDESGIYFFTRIDENEIKYAYIGQAVHILSRLCQHMTGFQHIDLSVKKHKLYSENNPYGWKVDFMTCPESALDEEEQFYIKQYANQGYQLRNKTAGGQGEGKSQIDEYRPSRGYRDGLEQGKKNCSKEIAHWFDLHLVVSTKNDPPTVNQQKALNKFYEFLNYYKNSEEPEA